MLHQIRLPSAQAFNENKLTVPEDVSMISINDIDIAKYVSPKKSKRMILLDDDLVFRKSFVI